MRKAHQTRARAALRLLADSLHCNLATHTSVSQPCNCRPSALPLSTAHITLPALRLHVVPPQGCCVSGGAATLGATLAPSQHAQMQTADQHRRTAADACRRCMVHGSHTVPGHSLVGVCNQLVSVQAHAEGAATPLHCTVSVCERGYMYMPCDSKLPNPIIGNATTGVSTARAGLSPTESATTL